MGIRGERMISNGGESTRVRQGGEGLAREAWRGFPLVDSKAILLTV